MVKFSCYNSIHKAVGFNKFKEVLIMKGTVRKRLVVFASGSGTTLQAVIDAIESKVLDSNIVLVVSDVPDAYALERAKNAGIDTYTIQSRKGSEMDAELEEVLGHYDFDLIVLAGYLRMIGPRLLGKYTIINTHPSLLPKYGGKGMHGMHVHQAIVDNREKESGVTVHFVDEQYDHGNVIWQTKVPVYEDDTAEDVSIRVQAAEKTQLVSVLRDFSKGKIFS